MSFLRSALYQLLLVLVVIPYCGLVLARSDLLVGPYRRWPFHASYDVSPDGDRFAMIRPQSEIGQQIVVTVNWTTELDRVLREQR